ncbi:unnamed protein product [Allacma fusca]|uniref:Timeless n=1 Tax=Allacma fusca TaxID=39272 RepID=A0A8J2P046_9HEXA|nr:unnamed protein product [Allacma fusca]
MPPGICGNESRPKLRKELNVKLSFVFRRVDPATFPCSKSQPESLEKNWIGCGVSVRQSNLSAKGYGNSSALDTVQRTTTQTVGKGIHRYDIQFSQSTRIGRKELIEILGEIVDFYNISISTNPVLTVLQVWKEVNDKSLEGILSQTHFFLTCEFQNGLIFVATSENSMEWLILNPWTIHETFGLLGFVDAEGIYNIRDTCESGLEELLGKLENDGQYFRTRRTLGTTQVISKDLVPLLIRAGTAQPKLVPKVIRLLTQLTLPVECLLNPDFAESEEGSHISVDIESLLRHVKEVFSQFKTTEVIVDRLRQIAEKMELSLEDCQEIGDSLLLIRNLLHITETEKQVHNRIVWNLFAQNLDKILLYLMNCEQRHCWGVSMVQLISLIYKDQHVSTLQKLLSQWLENSLTESSEDNESNTSPQGLHTSTMVTSDPTSDSSDTGVKQETGNNDCLPPPLDTSKTYTKTRKMKSHATDMDSGVSLNESCSQEEMCEQKVQDSTSSNEEENNRTKVIWNAPRTQDKHKKKLHKRIKRNALKQQDHPTDEDISTLLRDFTVHFLIQGYGSLVTLLQDQLGQNPPTIIDKSHFLWLITYFLKFATQLELDLETLKAVLSERTLSYLTFEGLVMSEDLSICKDNLKPHLRRMHLVVTSIREFILAVETYSKMPTEDSTYIDMLQNQIIEIQELRYLFLLLIRVFKPGRQSKQYLQDLITTNHALLLLLERISSSSSYHGNFQMTEYLKEFTAPIIMQRYGNLLEDFDKNGEVVNDCIFTMMHHVAGDLDSPEALYQPLILRTFAKIWGLEYEIRDDWADLMEYIIQRFVKSSKNERRKLFKSAASNISRETGFNKEEIEKLYWLYSNGVKTKDPIGTILEAYKPSEIKTRESVIHQLLHQRIIGYNQFLQFLSCERVDSTTDKSSSDGSIRDPLQFSYISAVIEVTHIPQGCSPGDGGDTSESMCPQRNEDLDIKWIQQQVLEVCYARLVLEQLVRRETIVEPVAYHFTVLSQSVPIVPWTKMQEKALRSPSVILLLHKLGFHLANDVGKLYPRIPHFWTIDVLFSVAQRMGKIENLKFDESKIGEVHVDQMNFTNRQPEDRLVDPTNLFNPFGVNASPCPSVDWMSLVQKSKMMGASSSVAMEEEHMDDCASLTALPPTEASENVSVMSEEEDCDL